MTVDGIIGQDLLKQADVTINQDGAFITKRQEKLFIMAIEPEESQLNIGENAQIEKITIVENTPVEKSDTKEVIEIKESDNANSCWFDDCIENEENMKSEKIKGVDNEATNDTENAPSEAHEKTEDDEILESENKSDEEKPGTEQKAAEEITDSQQPENIEGMEKCFCSDEDIENTYFEVEEATKEPDENVEVEEATNESDENVNVEEAVENPDIKAEIVEETVENPDEIVEEVTTEEENEEKDEIVEELMTEEENEEKDENSENEQKEDSRETNKSLGISTNFCEKPVNIVREKNDENIRTLLDEEMRNQLIELRSSLRGEAKTQIRKIQKENTKYYNWRRKPPRKYHVEDRIATERTQLGGGLKLKSKFLGWTESCLHELPGSDNEFQDGRECGILTCIEGEEKQKIVISSQI